MVVLNAMGTRCGWVAMLAVLACGCGDDGAGATDDGSAGSASGPGSSASGSDGTSASTSGSGSASSTGVSSTGPDTSDDTTGGPPPGGANCDPLPPPEGEIIMVNPGDPLEQIVGDAPSGATILLADGNYDVSGASFIVFRNPGVALRSASGDPEDVVLDGGYSIGSVLNVQADDVTIAEVTIQRPMWHPIHVTGGDTDHTENTLIYRVRIFDPGQQAIKINGSGAGFSADGGTIACSHVELTAAGRPNVSGCYTGGVDAHLAWGWTVRDNYFAGFWCDDGLSEHAVHFWSGGRDTVVEGNTIVDCARGVGFGLSSSGDARTYDDDPCPGVNGYVGHYGGTIRNNMIWAGDPALLASAFGFDAGVALAQACEATVVHNTVVSLAPPFASIEYRFGNTSASIANNLTTHAIRERDGGTAELQGNIVDAGTEHFVDAAAGDLHLVDGSSAIDAGTPLAAGVADLDFEGDARDASPDVGADEVVP